MRVSRRGKVIFFLTLGVFLAAASVAVGSFIFYFMPVYPGAQKSRFHDN